jgi:hypothetical protein
MVGSGKWVRGVLTVAALLAASGGAARAEDASSYPPPDIVGDIAHMFSWIDDHLTEAIRAGQPQPPGAAPRDEAPAPEPKPVPPPVASVAPEKPVPAAPAETGNPLADLADWLDGQLEEGARASHPGGSAEPTAAPPEKSVPEPAAPPPQAAQPPSPQAEPTPVPAAPVVTAEPLDLTGKAQPSSNPGSGRGLLIR